MQNSFLRLVFLLFLPALSIAQTRTISLENSTLWEFSQFASSIVSRPIVVTSELNKPFSLHAAFESDDELLNYLKNAVVSAGYVYDDSTGLVIISDVRLVDVPQLVTKQFALKHQSSAYVVAQVKNHMAGLSTVVSPVSDKVTKGDLSNNAPSRPIQLSESPALNAVIVTATTEQIKHIEPLITALDVPSKQVLIEAVISELSKKSFEGLDTRLQLSNDLDSVASNMALVNPAAGFSLRFLNHKSVRFFLDYVNTSNDSKILSTPKVLVTDRAPVNFVVGQNVPFITGRQTSAASPTTTPFQTIERHDIGLKLRLTPVITAAGRISVDVYQENSSLASDSRASDVVTNLRSLQTTIVLDNGHPVLIGGLTSQSFDTGEAYSIPILSQIPVIGHLFRSDSDKEDSVNLVIMLTATIVDSATDGGAAGVSRSGAAGASSS